MRFRVGFGYDIHRFAEGRKMVLGGVEINHPRGLKGHSDADALLHAICDALLGAAGLRDIGYYFSDKNPEFKDIDSRVLLARSWKLAAEKGWTLGNIDCTVVAEEPRINPHIPDMIAEIAKVLNAEPDQISIKATTQEGLGSLGRAEGLAAYAVVLLVSA